MDSIKYIYRIGCGPSSSHTMAPRRAAQEFLSLTPEAVAYRVTLYGSLAATGRGHLTDAAITDVLSKAAPVAIEWRPQEVLPEHPNGMKFEALGEDNAVLRSWTTFSVGGGALSDDVNEDVALYDKTTIRDILEWCQTEGYSFWEYVERCEGSGIWDYLAEVWRVMQAAIKRGLDAEGVLPGGLGVRRKAGDYYIHAHNSVKQLYNRGLMYSFALAVIEENAAGGTIVTAPTCGSCGVLPAVLYYMKEQFHLPDSRILRALATAGLFGNVVKHNASISGAQVGCQGEIGVACAMAAAASCQLSGGSISQIEYAAEMGLEHHLGLTCDPVCGLVQIPCIERNAFAATRAYDAGAFAMFSDGRHRVPFDNVVKVMRDTGHDLPS
ncbi:MAG: L-serine ammonia-lyase, iron-sulfur-dependent, subunit alpha, partial [Bacteroidaceae bacterium]|nr:L-serine ammonia-lyase, iron-sulfur-dependent, subunit alpha [Bacteroidaceae bacterium]